MGTTRHIDAMHSAPDEFSRNENSRVVDAARDEVDCQAKLACERRIVVKRHSARALVQAGVGLEHDRAHDRDVRFRVVLEDGCKLHVHAILNEHALVINRRDQETELTAGPDAARAKNLDERVRCRHISQDKEFDGHLGALVTTHTNIIRVDREARQVWF